MLEVLMVLGVLQVTLKLGVLQVPRASHFCLVPHPQQTPTTAQVSAENKSVCMERLSAYGPMAMNVVYQIGMFLNIHICLYIYIYIYTCICNVIHVVCIYIYIYIFHT